MQQQIAQFTHTQTINQSYFRIISRQIS